MHVARGLTNLPLGANQTFQLKKEIINYLETQIKKKKELSHTLLTVDVWER